MKASGKKLQSAEIFVSYNEWRVARSSKIFVFHIWTDVSSSAKILVLTTDSIGKHIPIISGDGNWQSVRIPVRFLADESDLSLI